MKHFLNHILWAFSVLLLVGTARADELHDAVRHGKLDEVRALLEAGKNPNFKDTMGSRPVFLARNREMLDLLVDAGARVGGNDNLGNSLLNQAARYGRAEVVSYLIEHKVDPNQVDEAGNFPLFSAAAGWRNGVKKPSHENEDIARYLIANGAKANLSGKSGTALHKAVQMGKPALVAVLLQNGAMMNAKDPRGKTPGAYVGTIFSEETRREVIQVIRKAAVRDQIRMARARREAEAAQTNAVPEVLADSLGEGL